ncbi:MAG: potassium channel family protein [Gammaproteobacteria bacterium]
MHLVIIINSLIISVAVIVHYEVLERLSILMPKLPVRHRSRIVAGIFGALLAHIIEIWIFAVAYYEMVDSRTFGTIHGYLQPDLLNCAYFSFITYTTLGYGDLYPEGNIRFLAGLESLTGLVLITWTASFMFFEMQKYWESD